ncbi:MAG TPA: TetR family transcriptional regulator [Ktedonobacteraceae bacterium]|nr:TetR family transcriptional regulator [Ktedonobacteraceae bacterium]
MDDPERRRGRVHNAEGAREAILNAAEAVFAEHGFDGARVDAIAETAGYNKSLLFQYFGDKLGLYEAVTRRADREITEFEMRVLDPFLEDETIASDAHRFKTFLETIIEGLFDYLLDHPRLTRIILWEQAEGWQTFTKFLTRADVEDADRFRALLHKAHRAGLLRSDIDPIIQLTLAEQVCWSYLSSIPLYQLLIADEDLSSEASLERAKEYIVAFVVHGMMIDRDS